MQLVKKLHIRHMTNTDHTRSEREAVDTSNSNSSEISLQLKSDIKKMHTDLIRSAAKFCYKKITEQPSNAFWIFKSDMEKMQTASDLIGFVEHFCSSNTEDDEKKMTEQQSNAFWILLCAKLRKQTNQANQQINRTILSRILQLRANEPPTDSLRYLVERTYDPNDILSLVLQFPAALHIQLSFDRNTYRLASSTNYDLPIHTISRQGFQFKKQLESILLKGIQEHVGGVGRFGGLVTENKFGQTPLTLLFRKIVAYSREEDWKWLCDIIKLAVQQNKISSSENDADSHTLDIPLLHAALDLGSPLGLINRILLQSDVLTKCDSLGRTPLLIAAAEKNTSYDLMGNLIRKNPAATRQKDKQGNLPLHLKIKAGRKAYNGENKEIDARRDAEELNVIGAIVQGSPESLEIQDVSTKLPPFMLASVDNKWPINIVYGLLRTSPWVITSYSSKD